MFDSVVEIDDLNPVWWPSPLPYTWLYLDNTGEVSAVISIEDHAWALQWLWKFTPSKSSHKLYATRATREQGKPKTIYLHKAVLLRAKGPPPTPAHSISDHLNGDSLDCRRTNLRWATPRMNRANYYGQAALQPDLLEGAFG